MPKQETILIPSPEGRDRQGPPPPPNDYPFTKQQRDVMTVGGCLCVAGALFMRGDKQRQAGLLGAAAVLLFPEVVVDTVNLLLGRDDQYAQPRQHPADFTDYEEIQPEIKQIAAYAPLLPLAEVIGTDDSCDEPLYTIESLPLPVDDRGYTQP